MPATDSRFDEIITEIRPIIEGIQPAALKQTVYELLHAERIFAVGAGRSGLLMKMFAMRLMQAGMHVFVLGESITPAICKTDLLVITSGSGATATMCALAEKANAIGAKILLITYTEDSRLATYADTVLYLPVPTAPERPGGVGGSQPLGTLFDQSVQFTSALLTEAVIQARGENNATMQARHANLE